MRVELEVRFEVPLAPGREPRRRARARGARRRRRARSSRRSPRSTAARAGARIAAPFQAGWCSWYHFFHDVTRGGPAAQPRRPRSGARARSRSTSSSSTTATSARSATGSRPTRSSRAASRRWRRRSAPRASAPGLWTAPFCVVPESRLFEAHRDWLLRRGDGLHRGLHPSRCGRRTGWVYALDTSPRRGARAPAAHPRRDRRAGLLLPEARLPLRRGDAGRRRTTRARRAPSACAAGSRRSAPAPATDAFLLGCGCPLGPAVGVVDGMRIGPDVAPYWFPDARAADPRHRGDPAFDAERAPQHLRAGLHAPALLAQRSRLPDGAEPGDAASRPTRWAASRRRSP